MSYHLLLVWLALIFALIGFSWVLAELMEWRLKRNNPAQWRRLNDMYTTRHKR